MDASDVIATIALVFSSVTAVAAAVSLYFGFREAGRRDEEIGHLRREAVRRDEEIGYLQREGERRDEELNLLSEGLARNVQRGSNGRERGWSLTRAVAHRRPVASSLTSSFRMRGLTSQRM